MPVGVAATRRDAAVLEGVSSDASTSDASTDVLNFTRRGPSNRLGEAKHGILLPERGLLRPLKVRSLNNIQTPS